MAFFTINDTLRQKLIFSITPYKCLSSSSLSPTFPPSKHSFSSKYPSFFLDVTPINLIATKPVYCSATRETVSGISPIRSREKRVRGKFGEEQSLVDNEQERENKRFTNDVFRKEIVGVRDKRKTGTGSGSAKSKDSRFGFDSVDDTKSISLIKGNLRKNLKRSDGGISTSGDLGKEKIKQWSNKFDSREAQFRVSLEMCTKKGDVMAALDLYHGARKEGVRISQYHYTVLLYLCSSASSGVIYPAKSGTDSRSLGLNTLDSNNDDKMEEMVKENLGNEEALKTRNEEIRVSEETKKYALRRGFKIYEKMCLEKIPMNEATLTSVARMAMSMGDGDMAFDMAKQMKALGISPKLRSYGPSLSTYCRTGDCDKAFEVEKHMLDHGVIPEEPELEALLKVSVDAGKGDRVYYVLQKLRSSVRKVSPSTADLIEKWFKGKEGSRVGRKEWDRGLITQAIVNGGGGWHGHGWLGRGKWAVSRTMVGDDGVCKCCGEKLVTIDLDPTETENFAESVASVAARREKNSSFEKFQQWLDYYGPFEAVVDAANVGLYSQKRFIPSKINAVVNGIRQMLPSKKWPLIVLHNKRVTGEKMDAPVNKALIEKWKIGDALYATPTGSNDDWYWLYAAIKYKCLLVTNDEMRDHTFQLLGNDFFPKWKERHQVRFSFSDSGSPVFQMPPPCSVVIQESECGHWHIPVASEHDTEEERTWLCVTRFNSDPENQSSSTLSKGHTRSETQKKGQELAMKEKSKKLTKNDYRNLRNILSESVSSTRPSLLSKIENVELFGQCTIDFQI